MSGSFLLGCCPGRFFSDVVPANEKVFLVAPVFGKVLMVGDSDEAS